MFGEADKTNLGPQEIGPWRAQAFDLANQPDSAIAEFERYVKYIDGELGNHRYFLAGTHKRLGELYDTKGNTIKALEHLEKFVGLWKDADPELQPRVREARARTRTDPAETASGRTARARRAAAAPAVRQWRSQT